MELITSIKNDRIKSAVKLQSAKGRLDSGKFLIEGRKLIIEALDSGYAIECCFSVEGAATSFLPKNVQTYSVTGQVIKKISSLTTPQESVAVAYIKKTESVPFCDGFILALDRIQDPSNLGAILRSAEAFGTNTVILGEGCCDPYSPKSLRAAMGSTFRLRISATDLKEYLVSAKQNGYTVIGTGLDKDMKPVTMIKDIAKKVIVIGNEGSGISDEVKRICDTNIHIPMSGKNESLNAAVAASIVMWENMKKNVE